MLLGEGIDQEVVVPGAVGREAVVPAGDWKISFLSPSIVSFTSNREN